MEWFGALLVSWLTLFFVPFTALFWVLMVLEFIIFLAFIEHEQGFWATLTMILTLLGFQYLGGVPIVSYVVEHPFLAVAWVAGYFLVGTVWGVAKWWFFVTENRDRYNQARAEFLRDKKVTGNEIPENLKEEWQKKVKTGYWRYDDKFEVSPRAYNYKKRILMWMTYWPLSFIWTIIDDPVKKFFRKIYQFISAQYQKISDHVFKDVDKDFPAQKEEN